MQILTNLKPHLDEAISYAVKNDNPQGASFEFIQSNTNKFQELEFLIKHKELFDAFDLDRDKFVTHEEVQEIANYIGKSDDIFISDATKYQIRRNSKEVLVDGIVFWKMPGVNENFSNDVAKAIHNIPKGVRNLVLKNPDLKLFEVYLLDELMTKVFPHMEEKFYWISGFTTHVPKRIDISTKVKVGGINGAVIDYGYPKNITYHEIGHAFDDQLYDLSEAEPKNDRYAYSSYSDRFKEAYEADKEEIKEKIKSDEIQENTGKRLLNSYYIKNEDLDNAREETFAEAFCMIIIDKTNDKDVTGDFKRIPGFLSYFPRCKDVVLNAIEIFEPEFRSKPSSD